MRALSHLALLLGLLFFSTMLTILNLNNGWEIWMLPIFILSAAAALVLHITGTLTEDHRVYVYSILIFMELFYFIIRNEDIIDSLHIVLLALIVLSSTYNKFLLTVCIMISCFATAFRVFVMPDRYTPDEIFHILFHIVLAILAGVLIVRLIQSAEHMDELYSDKIDELELENKSAGDFLANFSHEIRTPVNAVIGLTGICIDKEKDNEVRDHLISVAEAGRRVAWQVDDILDYSEIDIDKVEVNNEEYTLSAMLKDLVSRLQPYKRQGVELIIDVDPQLPRVLRGDNDKIRKILWHLIINGFKYTKEGGVYVHLTYTSQDYGLNLCIDVTDTGVGMTGEEVDRVFDRFYQSDSGRARSSAGLGLGMPIVRGFIKAMGGFIKVSSTPHEGTTVHISIPQEISDETRCMEIEDREKLCVVTYLTYHMIADPNVREFFNIMIKNIASGLRTAVFSTDTMVGFDSILKGRKVTHIVTGQNEYMENLEKMEELAEEHVLIIVCEDDFKLNSASKAVLLRKPFYCFPIVNILNANYHNEESGEHMFCSDVSALVVDDENLNLSVASSQLGRYGIAVTKASSGQEAIDICEHRRFDVIFMDHMMPGMDGVEAMKRIKSEYAKERVDTVFIAFTANAGSMARKMFTDEGFDGILSKPVVVAELERILKSVLPDSSITYIKDDKEEAGMPETVAGEDVSLFDPLVRIGVNVKEGIEFCGDDEELYLEVLHEFEQDEKTKSEELRRFHMEKNWDEYRIRIHGIKSSSKTLGAEKVSGMAMGLENAAASRDEDYIFENATSFASAYYELIRAAREVLKVSNDQGV